MRSLISHITTRVRRDQHGATAVEYGIMVSLIAVVIIVAVTLLGGSLKETFNSTQCSIKGGVYTAATTGATPTDGSCSK